MPYACRASACRGLAGEPVAIETDTQVVRGEAAGGLARLTGCLAVCEKVV